MGEISTQREYETLDKEMRDATEKETQYRREIKHKEQRIRELDGDMSQKKELIDQQEEELTQSKEHVESELSERKKLFMELEAGEKEISKDMDEELLFKFERIVKKKGGDGIVSLRNGVCSSCHMILPVQLAASVRRGDEIVACPYCSSILFFEEAPEGEENYLDNDTAGSLSDLEDIEDVEDDDDTEYEEEDSGEKMPEYED
jgi:predicted  nucleic acid-binding Zn-ribbon protein